MEEINSCKMIMDRVLNDHREYDKWQYQLFRRIKIMSNEELEQHSCKFGISYEVNPAKLELIVPVHVPDLNYMTGIGIGKTYSDMFKFYWMVWNSVFEKTFFHGWASGVLAGYKPVSEPFTSIRLCSPSGLQEELSLKLVFLSLIKHRVVKCANTFRYVVKYERSRGEIGNTVIRVCEEKPALSNGPCKLTLGEGDYALYGV